MSYHLKITSISPECYGVSVKVENHIFQATFLKSKNGPFLVTFRIQLWNIQTVVILKIFSKNQELSKLFHVWHFTTTFRKNVIFDFYCYSLALWECNLFVSSSVKSTNTRNRRHVSKVSSPSPKTIENTMGLRPLRSRLLSRLRSQDLKNWSEEGFTTDFIIHRRLSLKSE